jgi:aspartate--ammonia ligase
VKRYIEEHLCKELNLTLVTVPLIVDAESGVNDFLDRDGSRTPVQFHITNDNDRHPIEAQVVQAATKWKRMALKQFGLKVGEGLLTDMRAVCKDYFLDHNHSAFLDQWDWELAITDEQRTYAFLTDVGKNIWNIL